MNTTRMIALAFCAFLLGGCAEGKIRFLVCPHEYSMFLEKEDDFYLKREILFNIDEYSYLVAKKIEGQEISIAQHYRSRHTFNDGVYPLKVSWEEPLHISTIAIIDKIDDDTGIAIKMDTAPNWRVYWLPNEKIIKIKETRVLYLPPFESLPVLE